MKYWPFLTSRIGSFVNAIDGLRDLCRTQTNARIHALATVVVVIIGLRLRITSAEWLWIFAAVAAVWSLEAINTAIELLTDIVAPEFHPLAKRAKDVSAGAVLIGAIGAGIIGLMIYGPYFFQK